MDKKLIKLGAQIELARRDFFSYCQLKAPDFYKSDRAFLVKLCGEFQDFLRACSVSFYVRIFEHNFVGYKEKIRRHTDV